MPPAVRAAVRTPRRPTRLAHPELGASPAPPPPPPAPPPPPPPLPPRQVVRRLHCGSCPQDRTGRGRHDPYRAGGSVPHPAGVAGHARDLVPLRLVRASGSPASPAPSSWRLSL